MYKKFITLHPMPIIDPGFLNRDVGQIGQTLKSKLGYIPEVWGLAVPEKSIEFTLEDQSWISVSSRFRLFQKLWKEAKNIDVLHLYHIWHFTFLFALLYKIRNSKGIVYVKLDCPYLWKDDIFFIFTLPILWIVNMIGVEDMRYIDHFNKKFPRYREKFIFTPCGAMKIDKFIGLGRKKKSIVLCGRFGDPIKNYELFLGVLENFDVSFLLDWSIYFVGGYSKEFDGRIQDILVKKPELRKVVTLTGFIQDKSEIYGYLKDAKFFLHTSKKEGEPNVQFDAMFCGCYMISTDVGSIKQNYPKKASSFYENNSMQSLYDLLKDLISSNERGVFSPQEIQDFCLKNFTWEKSLTPLILRLQECIK